MIRKSPDEPRIAASASLRIWPLFSDHGTRRSHERHAYRPTGSSSYEDTFQTTRCRGPCPALQRGRFVYFGRLASVYEGRNAVRKSATGRAFAARVSAICSVRAIQIRSSVGDTASGYRPLPRMAPNARTARGLFTWRSCERWWRMDRCSATLVIRSVDAGSRRRNLPTRRAAILRCKGDHRMTHSNRGRAQRSTSHFLELVLVPRLFGFRPILSRGPRTTATKCCRRSALRKATGLSTSAAGSATRRSNWPVWSATPAPFLASTVAAPFSTSAGARLRPRGSRTSRLSRRTC